MNIESVAQESVGLSTDRLKRFIRLFQSCLVLGISDELPQGAGVEALERVRLVAGYCRSRKN